MALSRIWSAFIIIAVLVAASRAVFSVTARFLAEWLPVRLMMPYDTVRYQMIGSPEAAGVMGKDAFVKYLANYAYVPADSVHKPAVIISQNVTADSVRLLQSQNTITAVYSLNRFNRSF
jgi:hypothetical protein